MVPLPAGSEAACRERTGFGGRVVAWQLTPDVWVLESSFPAKEAIFKAGHQGPLKSIRIEHEGRKPIARQFEVSISHTARTAVAVAMTVPAPPAAKTESQPRPKSSSSQEVGMRRIWVVYQLALLAAVSYLIVVNLWHR